MKVLKMLFQLVKKDFDKLTASAFDQGGRRFCPF